MTKIIILVCIALLLFVFPSCKTVEQESTDIPFDTQSVGFWSINGRGAYDSLKNESTIYFRLVVTNQLASSVNNIINWRVKLFVKSDLLLEINQDNYKTLFGDNVYVEVAHPYDQATNSTTALGHVAIYAESYKGKPIPGDIFDGKNPDSFEAIITIEGFTGYVYELSRTSTSYSFSRN
jgi:hypothetical protein